MGEGGSGDGQLGGLRVVIVDDDEWVRRGRVGALAGHPAIATVDGVDHAAALTEPARWDAADVVLVDAHDPERSWDRFPGVAVVAAVRTRRGSVAAGGPRIVVVTGHDDNELLRRRVADAGADWFFSHRDVRDLERLVAAVCEPDRLGSMLTDTGSGLNEALALIDDRGMREVFEPGRPQKAAPASRRQVITLRTRLSRTLKLDENAPLRRIAAVVNEARGVYGERRRDRP